MPAHSRPAGSSRPPEPPRSPAPSASGAGCRASSTGRAAAGDSSGVTGRPHRDVRATRAATASRRAPSGAGVQPQRRSGSGIPRPPRRPTRDQPAHRFLRTDRGSAACRRRRGRPAPTRTHRHRRCPCQRKSPRRTGPGRRRRWLPHTGRGPACSRRSAGTANPRDRSAATASRAAAGRRSLRSRVRSRHRSAGG